MRLARRRTHPAQACPKGRARPRRGKLSTICAARSATDRKARARDQVSFLGKPEQLRETPPIRTVGSYWPYATTLWDYTNRAMPFDRPGTLTADQVYAVTAYILHLNGIVGEEEVLNAETLPAVTMPNREGFVPDDRPDTGTK